MENIKVTFETITPLWTDDAWGNNTGIRQSSIIGSLRFWFDVYCKSSNIEVKDLKLVKEENINVER